MKKLIFCILILSTILIGCNIDKNIEVEELHGIPDGSMPDEGHVVFQTCDFDLINTMTTLNVVEYNDTTFTVDFTEQNSADLLNAADLNLSRGSEPPCPAPLQRVKYGCKTVYMLGMYQGVWHSSFYTFCVGWTCK